jgi:hypothetical protein
MRFGFAMLVGAGALLFVACGARVDLDVLGGTPAPRDAATEDGPIVVHDMDATFDATEKDGAPVADVETPDVYVPQAPHCSPVSDAGVPAAFVAPMLPAVGALPQVVQAKGGVVATPKFVSVTFTGDPLADELDDFVASLPCTDYWRQAVGDYGVGDGYLLKAVRLTSMLPSTIDDSMIQDILGKEIAAGMLPPNDPDTIYDVFLPDGVTVTLMGATSCQSFGGYHDSAPSPINNNPLIYAVVPRCKMPMFTPIGDATTGASHEMAEAVSDPTPLVAPTYLFTDDNHPGWSFIGAEIGDMCEFAQDSYYTPQGFPWPVQRIWSNRAAYAGTEPCVPAASPDYFWAAPLAADKATVDFGMGPQTVAAVHVPVGQTGTVPVQFAGNVMTPMNVMVFDGAQLLGGPSTLQLSLDVSVGPPGTMATLKINKTGSSMMGGEPFVLVAGMGQKQVLFWGLCSD